MDKLMEDIRRHLTADVDNNVYMIPGIIAFLQHPKRGIAYFHGEMKIGLMLSVGFALAVLWICARNLGGYWTKSWILAVSMIWLVFINFATLLPKIFLFSKLRAINQDQPNGNIRVALVSIFKKRYYSYNVRISVICVVSYFVSLPISVILWQQGIAECTDLLILVTIYVLKLFYSIYRYNKYFLERTDAPITSENPYGFQEIVYCKDDLKDTHPRLIDDICSICMGDYEEGDKVLIFSCTGGHYFHRDCINKWMNTSASCPLCKHGIY